MRELIINFVEGGEVVSGLDEGRNFYFFELDDLTSVFKKAYDLGSKEVRKEIQVLLDGVEVLRKELYLHGQDLKSLILNEMDSSYRKRMDSIIKKESNLVSDERFQSFIVRYDEVLCSPKTHPIPFFLSLDKSYRVYEAIIDQVQHLFYSNLSTIMESLTALNQLIIKMIRDTDLELHTAFTNFLNDEQNFDMYCKYVPTRLVSLSSDRIDALYPNYGAYQRYQDILFKHLAFYFGYDDVFNTHLNLLNTFEEEFHIKLFNGESFLEDEDFVMKIFNPVINSFLEKSIKKTEKLVRKQGLNDDVINAIYQF